MERRKFRIQGRELWEEPRKAGFPSMDGKERRHFLQRGGWVASDAN